MPYVYTYVRYRDIDSKLLNFHRNQESSLYLQHITEASKLSLRSLLSDSMIRVTLQSCHAFTRFREQRKRFSTDFATRRSSMAQ